MNKNGQSTTYFSGEKNSNINEKYGKSGIFLIKLY